MDIICTVSCFPHYCDIGFFSFWWLSYHKLALFKVASFQVSIIFLSLLKGGNSLVKWFSYSMFYAFFICSSCIYHCFPLFFFFFSSGGYRYLRPLVADVAVVAKCHLSALYRHEKGKLFAQLVDLLQFYEKFEINDHAGTQLTDDEVLQCNYDRFLSFQLLAFKKIPKVCF